MKKTILGIFRDSKLAGQCVSELKDKGYTKDISVIAKNDSDRDLVSHDVKQDIADGTTAGAASFVIPGMGLVVLGPIATTLTGAAAGALTGGIVETLVDWGVPEKQAKEYQDRIKNGEVLIAVDADEEHQSHIKNIMDNYGVEFIETHHAGKHAVM